MIRKSRSTALQGLPVPAFLYIGLLLMPVVGGAAEYSEAEDVPVVTSMVFTESSIALTVVRDSSGYRLADRTIYFVADRTSYSFQEVSEQKFDSLTMEEHVRESTRDSAGLGIDLSATDDCKNKGYRYDSGDHDMTGRVILQLPSTGIEFEMLCRSSVSSAVSVDGSVWIGTYTSGGHGNYGAEGVLVIPENGDPVKRLDIGRDIVKKLAVDPWSTDVWVATHSQLFRVSADATVLEGYALHRDFHERRPVVRVTASRMPVRNDPLAVLADWLGPESYSTLSAASENGVTLPGSEPLYSYAMFGNYMTHLPRWPVELAGALEQAQPTFGWRKFACLLPGDTAEQLCTTDLGEWPKNADRYIGILEDRYPGFVVTGPVYGPKGNEDLRGNRHSPGFFSGDILFADFDHNGVRDFTAVLIEEGTGFDPQLYNGPVGFVVICNGNWSIHSQIEYSCSELTEREPGGFRVELDYVDWEPYAETLLARSPASGDPRVCPFMLQTNQFNKQTRKGNKKLSIMSSFGRCDWFYYLRGGGYQGCQYCAD